MSNESTIHFHTVDDALRRLKAETDASEAHGVLCGMICATGRGDLQNWLSQIIGEFETYDETVRANIGLLEELHKQTLQQISNGNYALQLLLPHDDDNIQDRIDDLTFWCQGFLFGLTYGGVKDFSELPPEAREVVNDMLDMAQSSYETGDDEDENENAYAEIIEYLRIGVIVVYSELNKTDFPNITPTVH